METKLETTNNAKLFELESSNQFYEKLTQFLGDYRSNDKINELLTALSQLTPEDLVASDREGGSHLMRVVFESFNRIDSREYAELIAFNLLKKLIDYASFFGRKQLKSLLLLKHREMSFLWIMCWYKSPKLVLYYMEQLRNLYLSHVMSAGEYRQLFMEEHNGRRTIAWLLTVGGQDSVALYFQKFRELYQQGVISSEDYKKLMVQPYGENGNTSLHYVMYSSHWVVVARYLKEVDWLLNNNIINRDEYKNLFIQKNKQEQVPLALTRNEVLRCFVWQYRSATLRLVCSPPPLTYNGLFSQQQDAESSSSNRLQHMNDEVLTCHRSR